MPAAHRVIAHLDMDAFYASVELLRYPELRGLAVVIGGNTDHQPVWEHDPQTGQQRRRFAHLRDYVGRGVITTATYEARALGVNSAMGLMKAAKLAPDAILLPTDFDQYRARSYQFKAAVRAIAPTVEDRGIDEIYIDLTETVATRLHESADPSATDADTWWCAKEIATELKQAVRDATGLSCSIGLAPNKLLAKMASELDKPNGLTVITMQELTSRIWPLAVRKINGVGPKSAAKLARLSIETIGELAQANVAWLVEHFGTSYGHWLYAASHGLDDRPVVIFSEPVSMSRETTFDHDLHAVRDRAQLSSIFTALCVELADDLQRTHYVGKNIAIKLRFEDFRTVTRATTLPQPTDDPKTIRRAAGECLKRIELSKRIRLLGVRVGGLSLQTTDISGIEPQAK